MGNLAQKKDPVRLLLVGHPGSGKTGSLCSLIDMGFKLRILDYDDNNKPLQVYADTKMLGNVDVVTLKDKMRQKVDGTLTPNGIPMAYQDGLSLLDHWTYTDENGEVVDLGRSDEWGDDTIVVLDSLTRQGEAAMNRAMSLNNRTIADRRSLEWGLAQKLQLDTLTQMKRGKFHIIVMSHIKPVGPKETTKDDDQVIKTIRKAEANLIPTRLLPTAIGNALPPEIPGLFDTVLHVKRNVDSSGKETRIMTLEVGEEMDVKVPAKNFPRTLPIETGLKTLFEAQVPWAVEKLKQSKAA